MRASTRRLTRPLEPRLTRPYPVGRKVPNARLPARSRKGSTSDESIESFIVPINPRPVFVSCLRIELELVRAHVRASAVRSWTDRASKLAETH